MRAFTEKAINHSIVGKSESGSKNAGHSINKVTFDCKHKTKHNVSSDINMVEMSQKHLV